MPKKHFFESHNDVIIVKRTRRFQQFLSHVLSIPVLKASTIVYDFVTIVDNQEFEKKKDAYNKFTKVRRLKDTKNLDGLVYSKANESLIKNHGLIVEYNDKMIGLLGELETTYDILKEDFNKVSGTLYKIGDIHKSIAALSKTYGDPPKMKDTFETLKNLNFEWSNSYKSMVTMIETEFKEMFSAYQADLLDFAEMHDLFTDYKDEYIKSYANLRNKKEKLFSHYPVNKWEMSNEDFQNTTEDVLLNKDECLRLMCKKESQELEEIKFKFGVFCNSTANSYIKIKCHYANVFSDAMLNMSANNKRIIGDVFGLVKLLHTSSTRVPDLEEVQNTSNKGSAEKVLKTLGVK